MILKSLSLIMDEAENIKSANIRAPIFKIWSLGVTEYEQKTSIQARVLQCLREDYLAEYMADFLHFMATEKEQPELMELVLRYHVNGFDTWRLLSCKEMSRIFIFRKKIPSYPRPCRVS